MLAYLKKIVSQQPFIMAQLGAIVMLLLATGLPLDPGLVDTILTAAFAVLALVVEVWGWWNVTPVSNPMDNFGNHLVPETSAE